MWLLVKNLVFTVVVPGAVTVALPRTILERWPAHADSVPAVARAGGLVAVLAGATLYASALAVFAFAGRGTPAPVDPPRQLVVSGPYRWTRNPMYTGVTMILAGESLYFGAPALVVYTIVCFAMFHSFVVLYEEPHLARAFGEAYATYRASVRRWLPRAGLKTGPYTSR